jgi:lipoprotein-anchoring transpeptidase ErfK/SrfK
MPGFHGFAVGATARRRTATTAGLLVLACLAAACQSSDDSSPTAAQAGASAPSASPTPQVTISDNLPSGSKTMRVDKFVQVSADQGTLDSVVVTYGKEKAKLHGAMKAGDTRWKASERLEPGTRYTVVAKAQDAQGLTVTKRQSFRSDPLTLDQQTFPSIAPLAGETVGVGMPVIVTFDVAVTDRASIEKHLHVTNTAGQPGAWHWLSDHEVHWRPKTYWKPGTDVTVKADINSIPAGNGIYGQLNRSTTFHVGDSMVSKVNVQSHEMKVYRNGTLLRTVPISAGKAGFITRSGIKVIIEKFRHKHMDAATTGIKKDDPEYYNIEDVEYAMRVTYSGEFLHAAPWSVGSQGSANTSHGCVGMSTENAKWLFGISKIGDVVEYTGSPRPMTLTNGYGDWNSPWSDWLQGSALA